MAGGQELTLVILGFLTGRKVNDSLDGRVLSLSYACTKPGWENVFERLCFLSVVLSNKEMLVISEMPGRLWARSSLAEPSSWTTFSGKQE